ncbi:MAG: hypothetical protein ACW98K_07835 [Candidatus Kariarchaeaceae archaeon]
MRFDSSHYWNITIILLLYRIFYIYFVIVRYFFVALPLFGYVPAMLSARDDGQRVKAMFPSLFLDLLFVLFIPIFPKFDLIHFLLLLVASIALFVSTNQEVNLFGRTIASLNATERVKARKAMKSMDHKEILEVAQYQDWKHL